MREVRVAAIQVDMLRAYTGEEKEENVRRALRLIDEAVERGAQIVCPSEYFNAGPWITRKPPEEVWEPFFGPTMEKMAAKAKEHGVYIVAGSIPALWGRNHFNSGAVISPSGQILGTYIRSMHYPYCEAKDCFPTFETEFATIGVVICGD